MARKPRFELHILPMFRITDREHMVSFTNLFDYKNVRDNYTDILGWLKGSMPPRTHGGPWPDEWIALFDRWGKEGFAKLESAAATYTAERDGDFVSLIARGSLQNQRDAVWIQRLNEETNPRRYILYREPSDAPASPGDFETQPEMFEYVSGVDTVVVVDEAGEHTVQITGG